MTKDQTIAALTERVAYLERRIARTTPSAAQVKAMIETEIDTRRAEDAARRGEPPVRFNGVIR